jgi:hypothetical protein
MRRVKNAKNALVFPNFVWLVYILSELYVEERKELAIVSERWTIDEDVKYPSHLKGPK